MLSITRQYEISSGHHLPLHEGKCRSPHGHNYIIEVSVKGDLQKAGPATGMVTDFADLDHDVKFVLALIDHKNLNDIFEGSDFFPPTAENLCRWLVTELLRVYPAYSASVGEVQLHRVRVWETRDSYVEWE